MSGPEGFARVGPAEDMLTRMAALEQCIRDAARAAGATRYQTVYEALGWLETMARIGYLETHERGR